MTQQLQASRYGIGSQQTLQIYALSFTAAGAGAVNLFVRTDGDDNGGPILDNAQLAISPTSAGVPRASTWTLMILGFGGAGAMLRRGRRSVAAA